MNSNPFLSTSRFRGRFRFFAAGVLLAVCGAPAALAAPAVNSVTTTTTDSNTHTVSHTVAGNDRLLTVCVVFDDNGVSVSSVTFGGTGLTKLTQALHSGGKPRVELWRLFNPAATTANVVVNMTSAKKTTVGVISFTGVDQTTPIDGTTIATGTTSTATVNVASAAGDLVVDCMGTIASPATPPTVGILQTSRFNLEEGGSIRGAGSTEPGAGTVTMSWGLPESKEWATIGFNVNAVSCGNGTVDAGESCDDGIDNGTSASCCTSTCTYQTAGTACGDDGDSVCDNPDSCDASGTCLANNEPDTTECRTDTGDCDVAEFCDGAGACPADTFENAGTACGDDTDSVCDDPDTCDANGACLANNEPGTTECREDAGDCDVAEFCDGAGACPADTFENAGTTCGNTSSSECDNPDSCDAGGNCLANHEPDTTACGDPSSSECDDADTCDGSGSCSANYEAAGTGCGDPGDSTCDSADTCDGSGTCLANIAPDTTVCRTAVDDCDSAEFCNGAGACPDDAFEPVDTACGSPTDSTCDNPDTCDGGGNCLTNNEPDTTECRSDAGLCDVAEFCDGAGACPDDAFEPVDTACGSPTDSICDNPDTCDGSGNCLVNNEPDTVECRADAGACDVAENCDGAGACPADAFEPADTACGDPADTDCDNPDSCDASGSCLTNNEPAATACGDPGDSICDNPDTCDGSGSCAANNEPGTVECRAAAGDCDAAETCDGAGACPADALEPAGTACGDPTDSICDNPDTCDGSGNCLVNNEPDTVECRADAGACDVAENCDGAGACPADAFEPADTACGDPADTECDNPDSCDGAGTCAANVETDGTACSDGSFCNGADTCVAGACDAHAGDPCAGPDGDEDCSESCVEDGDSCDGNDPDSSPCDDGDVCNSGETCSAGTCGGGAPTECEDGDLCTVDSCDPVDGCVYNGEPLDAASCFLPGKFSFAVKDAGDLTKNSIKWGWKKGEPVDPADLGTPTATTSYSLCVFDHTDGVPELVGSYVVPPGPTWITKPGQMKYADKLGAADGVTSLKGKASLDPFKSSVGLKGKGASLAIPDSFSANEYFALDTKLTVQLRNDEGACWTSDFTPLHVKKNTGAQFKATGP